MTVYTVGTTPGADTVSDAIRLAGDGDTIAIPAGTYVEDYPAITHSVTMEGIGGLAHLTTPGQPANGKAILDIVSGNVTLDHLELSGATVPDGNGAGIRFESGNLTITNSWIHNNQDGLLGTGDGSSTLSIDNSEFNNNGAGDGFTHNLYVGAIGRLTVTNSYFHDALGGHEIKSRALVDVITNNRIQDGPTANTNYSIDLPDGGTATVRNNVIEKGPNAENTVVVHFGGEASPSHANSSLDISGNTVINDKTDAPQAFLLNQTVNSQGGNYPATISGNAFFALPSITLDLGLATLVNNIINGTGAPTLDLSHPFDIPCFAEGTRILTPSGPVAVEELREGMHVVSAFGGSVPVQWIGRRRVWCRLHRDPTAVMPVRVRADAFGPCVPLRDVRLSPDHSVFIDGALIPIRTLVNGMNVVQDSVDEVTYFHVELPAHDVILAENLPAESYLDMGNRVAFENDNGVVALYPDFAQKIWEAEACAPQLCYGERHQAVVARLQQRALATQVWEGSVSPHAEAAPGRRAASG